MTRLTLFANFAAATKCERDIGLHELIDMIRIRSAPVKDRLPWLKLARFSDVRSRHGSLRHDANVLAVTGCEADYDSEQIGFDAAVDTVRNAGIMAIVYTSPSHTEDGPRWRVLAPFSQELPPAGRAHQVTRLNGLFGGVFSRESWTLSQAYYFGRVGSNPSHRVELLNGTPIDLAPGLETTAIGPPRPPPRPPAPPLRPARVGTDVDYNRRLEGFRSAILNTLRREALPGQKHLALLRCARTMGGILADAGWSEKEAVGWLLDALPDDIKSRSAAEQTAKDGLAHGALSPLVLEERARA